ncbi:hypothetical protein L1887_23240 [Cichorium endivia]|nr:hypothetical protein L1887_23240 [Cichorium endivia]
MGVAFFINIALWTAEIGPESDDSGTTGPTPWNVPVINVLAIGGPSRSGEQKFNKGTHKLGRKDLFLLTASAWRP